MRFSKMVRGASTRLTLLFVAGALVVGAAHSAPTGQQEFQNWSKDQAAYVARGPQGLSTGDAPDPPAMSVLVETSEDGSALGLEISALVLARHLGRNFVEGSDTSSEETLMTFHEVICLAISWLLDEQSDPGGPRELATTIDLYLVSSGLPRIDYPRARKDLEKIYVNVKRALSSDEVAREVAEAVLR